MPALFSYSYFYVCRICKVRVDGHPTDPRRDEIEMVPEGKPGHWEFVCVPCADRCSLPSCTTNGKT